MAGARLRPGNMVRWAVCRSPGAMEALQQLLVAMLVLAPVAAAVDVLLFQGYQYRTRDGASPTSATPECESSFKALPAGGWVLSPNTLDAQSVAGRPVPGTSGTRWGTQILVMADGTTWWSNGGGFHMDYQLDTQLVPLQYKPRGCTSRLLLRRPCAPGSYHGASKTLATEAETATCTPCVAGTYSNAIAATDVATCTPCKAGTYSDAIAATCTPCKAGTYSDAIAATCTPCKAGTYSTYSGTTSSTCIPGRCGRDMYSTKIGAAAFFDPDCLDCPEHSTAPVLGNVNRSICSCIAGYSGPNGGPCIPCPAGSFKADAGSAGCTQCAHGKRSTTRSVDKDDCVTMQAPMVSEVCPKAPIQNWGDPRFSRCKLSWAWEELYDGYRNHSITWYHGSLHTRRVTGKFEHYVCVKDDPCSTDLTDAFFCYVWSIRDSAFLPWGPNSVLKLLHLPVTQDEVLHLRAANTRMASDLEDLTALLTNLTATVAALAEK